MWLLVVLDNPVNGSFRCKIRSSMWGHFDSKRWRLHVFLWRKPLLPQENTYCMVYIPQLTIHASSILHGVYKTTHNVRSWRVVCNNNNMGKAWKVVVCSWLCSQKHKCSKDLTPFDTFHPTLPISWASFTYNTFSLSPAALVQVEESWNYFETQPP